MIRKMLAWCCICTLTFMLTYFYWDKKPGISVPAFLEEEIRAKEVLSPATADGTFIQWWLVEKWTDEDWLRECEILKEAGMNYIVLAPTALYQSEGKSGQTNLKTIYPTRQTGFEILKTANGDRYPDVVDACLRNAQKTGLKVFLGLNFSDSWWLKSHDRKWLNERMAEGNRVAEELWKLYRPKYGDTMYGWYWCWEVDNFNFKVLDIWGSKKLLADAIKAQTSYMEEAGIRLPVMLAPFMDWRLGSAAAYGEMWKYVLKNSGLKAGDIFCPQDCIGSKKLRMDNYTRWFAELRKAVDAVPGIKFWADTETFDISDWTSAPLERFVRQMNDVRPYVDNCITFAYSHYYSPNVIAPGFHNTYIDYVKKGKMESIPPATPTGLVIKPDGKGNGVLSWIPSSDNMGIFCYDVFRDGKRIERLKTLRFNAGGTIDGPASSVLVDKLKLSRAVTYEVQAVDFAGNVSGKASIRY